jgi:hypothetical protein
VSRRGRAAEWPGAPSPRRSVSGLAENARHERRSSTLVEERIDSEGVPFQVVTRGGRGV